MVEGGVMGNDNEFEMPPVAAVATMFKQLYKVVFVLGLLWLRVGDKWRRMEDVELRAKITKLIDNEMGTRLHILDSSAMLHRPSLIVRGST